MGVGVSVGAQTGVYVYAEAGYGKGSNHLESTTHNNTTLNADQISIKSQGDTTLKGAQATANRIDADVGGNLNIISQQDTLEQKNKQMGVGARVQVSAGTAWQASGNLSNSSANGSSNSVNQQAGLFAGDGGYHVKADQVDLKGGAIVSTAKKENNDLTANRLTFSDINNKSSYDATSVSLSGGTRFGEEKGTDSTGKTYTNNVNWRDSTTFSPTLPQQDKDSDSSTTYATISEGNISIGGKDTTVEKLGIHSDINTANQKVDALPDLQAILDKQKIVSDATSTIVAATRTYSQNKQAEAEAQKQAAEAQAIEKLQAEGGADWEKYNSTDDYVTKQNLLKNALPAYKDASDQAQAWGMGGSSSRALNAVTTAITASLGGQTDLQVVTNTLAPYAAQVIGQEFGHGEDKNTAAQLVSHAILGATLAYINGGDPTAGGSAAVASEAAANYLTNQLAEKYKDDPKYFVNGEFQANLLSETEKAQIRDLTAGIGAVIGGAVGDSTYNAQLAGVIGQNAVENNEMSLPFPLDSQRGQGYDSIVKYAQDKGLSYEETQKLIYEYGQPENKQAKEYIEGWIFEPPKLAASILVPELAAQKLEPIVVIASKSKWYVETIDTVKGWFSKRNPEDKVTVYRVDDIQFTPRINSEGEVPIVTTKNGNERALFLNFGDEARAHEFAILNRKGEATITAVDVDKKLLETLRETSIYDKSEVAKLNPTAPIVVDINKAIDQYGLRTPEQIQMFREALDPKTVRLIPLDPKKVQKK